MKKVLIISVDDSVELMVSKPYELMVNLFNHLPLEKQKQFVLEIKKALKKEPLKKK